MNTKPLPFQVEDVDTVNDFGGRVLLASEMGVGKSFECLMYALDVEPPALPMVVVCPKGLKLHWQREAQRHFGQSSVVLESKTPSRIKELSRGQLFIINYDILGPWLSFLKSIRPVLVVGDECHAFKNLRAQRTKNFRILCKGVPHVICVSGTPLTNRPWELFPVLNVLWPDKFPSPFTYGHQYCEAQFRFGHWDFSGAKNLKKLHRTLLKCGMIRRTKAEVLPQLPEKRRMVIPLPIERRKEYDDAERDLIAWLAKIDLEKAARAARAERYVKFNYLRQLAASLKLPYVMDWLDDLLEETDSKILVGCHHHEIIDRLHDRYKKISVVIHGGRTSKQREEAEDLFRNKKQYRMMIGQIDAAGVGLNLPEASIVPFVELPWTPGQVQQFIDRAHRLTSKHDHVDAYFLIAEGTIESKICEIIEKKQGTLDRVLDGVTKQESSLTIFDDLQQIMLRKGKL